MTYLVNFMIFLPAIGGLLCLFASNKDSAKRLALNTTIVTALLSVIIAFGYYGKTFDEGSSGLTYVSSITWIKSINVNYMTGVDGVSLPLVLLTTFLSILVVLAGWNIEKMTQAFMALYMFLLTGILGVFLSLDLFLFYVFFELSLLPMYFLIGIWGGPRKEYAAIKFFIYTLAGSICLLITMLGLYYLTQKADGANGPVWTMISESSDTISLQSEAIKSLFSSSSDYYWFAQVGFWLTLIAFMIKLPAVPFHTWLPDAHVQAPTPISMVLAGVLLKMGGYAMMRITWPIFPDAGREFWYLVALLGVFAIIYGAFCALAQTDWKKLVAYSSVSHMGYVTLGIAAMTQTGWDGAYYQMIGHGIVSPMMFFMVGVVYERAHHRDINKLGGLWLQWPRYGAWALVCFFAGLGLPGMAGFVGEVMALLGIFEAAGEGGVGAESPYAVYTLGIVAASGVVFTASYILWMFQRVYMGKEKPQHSDFEPINKREYFIMTVLGVACFVFGIVPYLVFSVTDVSFKNLINNVLAVTGQ